MFSPMKEMAVQFEGQHDHLKKEYNELMTDPNLPAILGQLEEAFADPFNAKVVLTKILMVLLRLNMLSHGLRVCGPCNVIF